MSASVIDKVGQQPRSVAELHAAKKQRQKMKAEQVSMLSEQNSQLISSLDCAEEELGAIQLEKLTIEEDNTNLRKSNFVLQANAKAAEGQLEEVKLGYDDLESQLETMRKKNAELFSLLEKEEANTAKVSSELETCKMKSSSLDEKYEALVLSSRESEETAKTATHENQLKATEIRVLRAEVEQLKQKAAELTIQSTVELEAVQEQLRLRKEKQYQLLGKLQSQEEESRQAEDQVKDMEQVVRDLRRETSELQTTLQLETNARISQDNSHRSLAVDLEAMTGENKQLSLKLKELEVDRLKLEADSRDNGEQLREMAEKVFQLLERLKLAELGKKKSMEALTKKEHELFLSKKQQNKIAEDNAIQKKICEKINAEKQALEDQLRGLKKLNSQLSHKLKEEAKLRLREEGARKEAIEKVRTLDGRLAFLLNRLETNQETRSAQQEEINKMDSQLQNLTQRCETLQTKLSQAEDTVRDANEKLQQSDKQLKDMIVEQKSMEQTQKLKEEQELNAERKSIQSKSKSGDNLAGGQLRFFLDNRDSLGHVLITGKCPKDKVWIEEKGCNKFLRKVLKSQNIQEPLIKKIAELYGRILFEEEQLEKVRADLKEREQEVDHVHRELNTIQSDVLREEESKRCILLKYICAVKASASLGEPGCEEDRKEVGGVGAGKINLLEANLFDEEMHVVASVLRNNATIEELQFRRNQISDDGARAIAAVLAGRNVLKFVDLRENHISIIGVKLIADALERSERIHKVIVHPGGKIEALGAYEIISESESPTFRVKTLCIVDVRENKPKHGTQSLKRNHGRRHLSEGKGIKSNDRLKK